MRYEEGNKNKDKSGKKKRKRVRDDAQTFKLVIVESVVVPLVVEVVKQSFRSTQTTPIVIKLSAPNATSAYTIKTTLTTVEAMIGEKDGGVPSQSPTNQSTVRV